MLVPPLAVGSVWLAGCQREVRRLTTDPAFDAPPTSVPTALFPGRAAAPSADPRDPRRNANAYELSEGGRLYRWFNCNGCHFNGGGGIGPALMDAQWRYGGSIEQIYASIAQGRPNGMPAWGLRIPSGEIWQIAAYVRSLSSNAPPSAESTRRDAIAATPPPNQVEPVGPAFPPAPPGQRRRP